jgi:hypothetical protein
MVKKTIINSSKESRLVNTVSANGVTIGELEPLSTSQIKDTDLFAVETDLSSNSVSMSQVKEVLYFILHQLDIKTYQLRLMDLVMQYLLLMVDY